ncbi:RagB/SusD family nutrient uptake outer membrane protein [Fulvivirga sp. RKSG066]|uniref:RagB/SusD family nutrient uptake outer membrane protein n=1 Tax=Fulvivirga aurantia TaxID=2529383 RepID=UPI0012BD3707|nr:RagB/SusD family nutrient uptake outer membrane protein [Fulvivirga aurantia]MTI22813.1 RagB/SusD family nutrient uptake outer membrane protein [Fulvivirga aurantia]
MKKIIYILIGSFLINACSDDFINPEPKGEVLEDNYYVSEDQFFNALISAYDPLQWTFPNGFWTSNVMYAEIRSDNANAGGDPSNSDQPGWQQIDDFTNNSFTNESESFWKRGWWGIYRANLLINNDAIESELINTYKAEAKFLRAYYHFDLFRIFGPVPIVDEVLNQETFNTVERATITDLFTFMTQDLKEAIDVLPDTKYTGSFAGRVSKTTAQALLGKIYLYQADFLNDDPALFDLAAAQFEAVINSGQYELLDDYNDLFAFGAKNTEESVFEIQYTNQIARDFSVPGEIINGNMITQLSGIRGLCGDHPDYLPGWGFTLPTSSLFDHYLADDSYRRDASIISLDELNDIGCSVDQAEQNAQDYTGYWQQKYANYNSYSNPNGGEINVLKDPNEPVIRYADVLLMYAEALVRGSGSDAEAMVAINEVRERAAGPDATDFRTAQELMTEEGLTLLELIWYERRAELALEGHRWFDLVRSDRASASLFTGDKASNFNENSHWLAAPQKDIDNTAGSISEYPSADLFK